MTTGGHEAAATRPSGVMLALLLAIASIAVVVPLLVVTLAPPIPAQPHRHARVVQAHKRVVPAAELPPVEPVEFQSVDPDDARAFNATVPFSTAPNPAARPFHLPDAESDLARARAVACMTAAVLFEAGDDAKGEKAVAQVVINRIRHPAFPQTVCGVVFQGSERATGCQFTFTCDGALARTPSVAAWKRAREIAEQALDGAVFKPVGLSTHYHTDWVVPYWSASLDKVAAVGTHLFFRWTGWWGTPPAFRHATSTEEPDIALLARFSDAHKTVAELAEVAGETGGLDALDAGTLDAAKLDDQALPSPVKGDANSFLVTLDRRIDPATYGALAARVCGMRPYCKFMAWTDQEDTPAALPLDQRQVATMAFSYLRDRAHGYDKPLWNCGDFDRPDPAQCMKLQVLAPTAAKTRKIEDIFLHDLGPDKAPIPMSNVPAPTATPEGLAGIRRKQPATPPPAPRAKE